jgi:hypothetical protein
MGLFDFFKKKDNEKQSLPTNANKQEQLDDFTSDMAKSADFFIKNYSDKFKGLDLYIKRGKIPKNF